MAALRRGSFGTTLRKKHVLMPGRHSDLLAKYLFKCRLRRFGMDSKTFRAVGKRKCFDAKELTTRSQVSSTRLAVLTTSFSTASNLSSSTSEPSFWAAKADRRDHAGQLCWHLQFWRRSFAQSTSIFEFLLHDNISLWFL